jgi:site-specific DNA recombinase
MKNIATRYIAASPIGKKQIIGSIFPEKLIFSENKLRITKPNVILELISRPVVGSEEEKKEKAGDNLRPFVPSSGSFANQFLQILKKILELKILNII